MLHPCLCLSLMLFMSFSNSVLSTDAQNLAMSAAPSSSNRKVVIAIVVTFFITLMIASISFFFCEKYARRRLRNKIDTSFEQEAGVTCEEFRTFGRKVKGLIVEENGQDVIYVKDLEDRKLKTKFSTVVLNPSFEEEVKRTSMYKPQEVKEIVTESVQPNVQSLKIIPSAPPPPPPPPPVVKRNSVPPPKTGGLVSSLRPPSAPRRNTNNKEERSTGSGVSNMKLKPLHWDKVMANADHSMVWNEIIDGSLRFDDNQIETLFAYSSRKIPQGNGVSLNSLNPVSTAQTFILESRKSQNTAIVLKSLAVSRKEILDALLEGHGLTTDVLEKLTRIAPTQEEEAKILKFGGNPTKLADAESFLYYILKAVPFAFIRINAMLFRTNYDADILDLKESLQTLELGCKELRSRGLFLKLLEAILKAGNKMNAGTSRGNAQGFNLNALTRISGVKSTDGKTTLLHFVVEQVIRSEGRRCVLNQKRSIERGMIIDSTLSEAERDKEYLVLGLQSLRGLSIEFSNVKKAATIDYDNFTNTCSSLTARVREIRQLITQCGNVEGGGFVREMKGFLEETEEEIAVVAEEQTRTLELVKRTTGYYQAGASTNLLQLFVIVKDFLDKVDKVSMEISSKMQKKNMGAVSIGSTSPPLLPMRSSVKFPDFRLHLKSSDSSSSESDDDF